MQQANTGIAGVSIGCTYTLGIFVCTVTVEKGTDLRQGPRHPGSSEKGAHPMS